MCILTLKVKQIVSTVAYLLQSIYGDVEWSDTCRVNRSGKAHTSLSTCIYNFDMSNFDIILIVVCYICVNRIKYPFTDCNLQ